MVKVYWINNTRKIECVSVFSTAKVARQKVRNHLRFIVNRKQRLAQLRTA